MEKEKSKKCCQKCHAIIKAFPSSPDCDDTSCSCHMPNSFERDGEKELFDTVYNWGKAGVVTDENSAEFQRLLAKVRTI